MTKKLRQKIKCLGEIKENFSTVGTPPPLLCWEGEEWVEPPTKSSKGGRGWGLAGPQLLEGVCWKEGNEGGRGLIPQCTLCFHHFQRVFSCQK